MGNEPLEGDQYWVPKKDGESLFKDKGSKFIGLCYQVEAIDDINKKLSLVKKKYHDARHYCYGYRINPLQPLTRANDDGEPSNSAGTPIYNQIISQNRWNTLVVVVRYFGGTKLGVSGLINAYKNAAQSALFQSEKLEQFLWISIEIQFPYALINDVMRLQKEYSAKIEEEKMGEQAGYVFAVRKGDFQLFKDKLSVFHLIKFV